MPALFAYILAHYQPVVMDKEFPNFANSVGMAGPSRRTVEESPPSYEVATQIAPRYSAVPETRKLTPFMSTDIGKHDFETTIHVLKALLYATAEAAALDKGLPDVKDSLFVDNTNLVVVPHSKCVRNEKDERTEQDTGDVEGVAHDLATLMSNWSTSGPTFRLILSPRCKFGKEDVEEMRNSKTVGEMRAVVDRCARPLVPPPEVEIGRPKVYVFHPSGVREDRSWNLYPSV